MWKLPSQGWVKVYGCWKAFQALKTCLSKAIECDYASQVCSCLLSRFWKTRVCAVRAKTGGNSHAKTQVRKTLGVRREERGHNKTQRQCVQRRDEGVRISPVCLLVLVVFALSPVDMPDDSVVSLVSSTRACVLAAFTSGLCPKRILSKTDFSKTRFFSNQFF